MCTFYRFFLISRSVESNIEGRSASPISFPEEDDVASLVPLLSKILLRMIAPQIPGSVPCTLEQPQFGIILFGFTSITFQSRFSRVVPSERKIHQDGIQFLLA